MENPSGGSRRSRATSKSRDSSVCILLWPKNGPDCLELGLKIGKSVCLSNKEGLKTDFAAGLVGDH